MNSDQKEAPSFGEVARKVLAVRDFVDILASGARFEYLFEYNAKVQQITQKRKCKNRN